MIAGALLGLAVAAALFVLAPLRRAAAPAPWQAERERLLRAREAAYRALRELEFDRETGKLSQADYAGLHARYQAEAVAILRKLDAPAVPATSGLAATAAPASAVAGRGGAV